MLSAKVVFAISFFILVTAFSFSPSKENTNSSPDFNLRNTSSDSVSPGKRLALQYCQICHLFPDPKTLDKKTWVNKVLPNMAERLGLHDAGKNPYDGLPPEEQRIMKQLQVYPPTAVLSREEWNKIVQYYEEEAPAEPLPQKEHAPIAGQLPQFKAEYITLADQAFPKTTLLKFDTVSTKLYVGDAQNALYVVNNKFELEYTWWIDTAPTDIDFPHNASPRLLTIGIFNPSDQKLGRLLSLDKTSETESPGINIQGLPRPVQFASADLNMDGKEDVVICGFGNNAGKLFWLDDFQPAKEHILKALPGARRVEISDFNHDHRPDIIALMTQAREEISIFYNQGNGKFKEKVLLQFPPEFGSSYFELADFNKDGFQDILLTNGDNWDYSSINKNYHGVRIYLNDGADNFKEAWFYPLYGTSKAMARDFDNDGDVDIAAISFYSDLEQPEHGFVYFSNEGGLTFKPFSPPEAASGKWMVMDAADFDHDGDIDIVLGSYFQNISELTRLVSHGVLTFPQLLVLTNQNK